MPREANITFSKILIGTNFHKGNNYYARIIGNKNAGSSAFILPPSWIKENELEGKMIEFLADPSKKVLGFRLLERFTPDQINKNTTKLLQINSAGICQVFITRILISMMIPLDQNYKCPIKEYKDNIYGNIYYTELTKENFYEQKKRRSREESIGV